MQAAALPFEYDPGPHAKHFVEDPKGAISPAGQGRQGAGVEDWGAYVPATPTHTKGQVLPCKKNITHHDTTVAPQQCRAHGHRRVHAQGA